MEVFTRMLPGFCILFPTKEKDRTFVRSFAVCEGVNYIFTKICVADAYIL
jgi:hypothetical protein